MARARRWLSVIAPLAVVACIPEPPPELVGLPPTRPVIVRGSVVPTASAILTQFPSEFIVPVELADPAQPFYWAAFIDYNASNNSGLEVAPQVSVFEPGNTRGRVRTVSVLMQPPSPDRCHLVEILVARQFSVDDPRRMVDPPGGDVVSWFYNPGGSTQGCPSLDAGIDGSPPAPEGGPP